MLVIAAEYYTTVFKREFSDWLAVFKVTTNSSTIVWSIVLTTGSQVAD
jgi:hypothetical protein